jgi:predicted dehydrogenase
MKNLVGATGFIAPRQLTAITETGNNLVTALDKHGNVGTPDSYFPHADFHSEFERFHRHLDGSKKSGKKVDFISICSSNYRHNSCRYILTYGADAVCQKPRVLNPWNSKGLYESQKETQKNGYIILQIRSHSAVIELRNQVIQSRSDKIHSVNMTIDCNDPPEKVRGQGGLTYRSLELEGNEIEFSDGFTDLNTKSYKVILNGGGFALDASIPSIILVHKIRNRSKRYIYCFCTL